MPRNKEALIRYRVINRCLIDYKVCTKARLIKACEDALDVSPIGERTIDQDIHDMRDDNRLAYYAPIRFDRSAGGYCYADPGYSIDNLPLNQEELECLTFASTMLEQFRQTGLFSLYSGAVQKIINTVNIQKANIQMPYFDFVDFEKVPVIKGSEFLQTVIEAIRYKQVLKLHYKSFDRDEPVDHVVHPYLLKEYRNRWYIVGFHDYYREMRTFGLDRIVSIETVNKKYIDRVFNAREYYRHVIGVISRTGAPPEIIIAVKKHQAQYLLTQPLHESQEVVEEREDEIIFKLRVHPTYELISVFLGFGLELCVIEPATLREEIKSALKQALDCYGG